MNLNREQALFTGVIVVSGALVAWWWSDAYQKTAPPRGKTAQITAAPKYSDVEFAAVKDGRYDRAGRDFFIPPRDWTPLVPLQLDLPPLPEIGAVGPLLFPAPAPRHADRLRQPAVVAVLAAARDATIAAEAGELDASAAAAGGSDDSNVPVVPQGGANGGAAPAENKPSGSGADAKAVVDDQAVARRFDWIVFKGERRSYGRILNKNRLALLDDETLPIEFEAINLATGKVFSRNTIARDRLSGAHRVGFDFANTAANRALLREHAAVTEKVNALGFLAAARECLAWREEDPKAVLETADRLVTKSLKLDGGSIDAWALAAEIRAYSHDTEGELALLDRAKESGVVHPRLKAKRARILRKSGLLESAEALLVEATTENALDAEALRELGHLRLEQGDAKGAVDAFDRAEKLAGIAPETRQALRVDRAGALIYGGEFEAAFQLADSVVKGQLATADAWVVRGVANATLGKRDAALSDFKSALEADPRDRDAVYGLGVLTGLGGDLEAAEARFREAEELDPLRGFDTELARGILAEAAGDLEQASEHYARALERHPDHPFGLYRSGRLARRSEDLDGAAGQLASALLEIGDLIDVLNELGYVALLSDNFEDAEKYFLESLRREPNQIEVRFLLGAALVRQNRIGDARREFEVAATNEDPTALAGIAYCLYKEGDDEAAIERLSAAAGASKDAPESEIHRYAKAVQERIEDHRSKEQWVDVFDREQIKNDWLVAESAGPTVSIEKSEVFVRGSVRPSEADVPTQLGREIDGKLLVLFESDLRTGTTHNGFHGIRVVLEKGRASAAGQTEAFAEIAVAIFPDKTVRLFIRDQDFTQISQNWTVVKQLDAKYDPRASHRLAIERVSYDTGKFVVRFDDQTLTLDGKSEFTVPGLRKVKSTLKPAVFGQGKARENLDFSIESVRLVRYKNS